MINYIISLLTTENVLITNIFIFPFFFVDAYVGLTLFSSLLNISYTSKQKYCYIFLLAISCYICRVFIPNPYGIIINMIIWPVYIILIFKTSILKGIFAEIIPFAVCLILETFIEKMIYIFTQLPISSMINTPLYRIIIVSLVYTCVYLIAKKLKKYRFSNDFLEHMNKKNKKLIIANFLLGLAVIFCQFYLLNYYSDNFPIIVCLLNILCLIAYFVISLFSYINISKLETASMSLEESQLSYKTLELLYDNMRTFKHDFGNILDGFASYITCNDMEGLQKYYNELSLDFNHINNLSSLNPKIINNHSIYVLLANKYHKADEKGIKIDLKVLFDLNTLQINMYEFTRMLGILLDNAIEAASECEEKLVNVIFQEDTNNPIQYIIISNTYSDKNLNTEKIFEKNFSTKKGNTGLGLWEVKQLLKKNNRLNLRTSKTEKYFTQKLEIYY